jgi:ABC-type multidrug transport system fused ATPase/permease subunit
LLYAGQLVFLAGSLSSFLSQIMQDVFSTNKFLEIMQMQPTIKEIPLAHQIGRFNKGIEFNRVTFGYQPDKHILENLSFKMPAGHWYALVGPSGCGKTTIVSLLLRLYDLGGGEIVIDDYRLSEVALNSLGKNIAIAPAEPFLFDGSLKDNITCAVKSLSKQTIEEAARAAQIHDFIINLPLSYDTVIGENAFQLSEGQKQKIAIARALVRQPKILILDEAMASLDSESESRIIEGIRKLNIPLVIIISHRLSTVMACEYARYIKTKNTIVSSTPSALLENDRDFRALFNPQINKHA